MSRNILLAFFTLWWFSAFSQNLDRISISSGSKATDEVNYVIGETFNFSISGNGSITLETGTMGSTSNTGGLPTIVSIDKVSALKNIPFYPNPATDAIYFTINDNARQSLHVHVFDLAGKLCLISAMANADIGKIDIQTLATGSYISIISNSEAEVLGSFTFIKQ